MKGLFIPEITAEMFRNGCLESIDALMADGEIYDIEYSKWIPVNERLPEDRNIVFVTAYWHETYQVMMASYYGDGLWWCVPFNNCGEHMQR